jgi:hypothetical protein
MHARVLGKTADPAQLLFSKFGTLQAGCSPPGALDDPASCHAALHISTH